MTKTYEYTGINSSTTMTFPAAVDLAEANGKAVALAEEGLTLPEAGGIPLGIALITEDEAYRKGDEITVQVKDSGLWRAGGEIKQGDLLATDAEGLCQTATAGQWVMARALSAATAKGDLINVQIIHAGSLATATTKKEEEQNG